VRARRGFQRLAAMYVVCNFDLEVSDKEAQAGLKLMGHVSFCLMLIMLIYRGGGNIDTTKKY
jgi:hypothetical protein